MREIKPDLGNRFLRLQLSADDEALAYQVSPLFLAYLQNKISDTAGEIVEAVLPYEADPKQQMLAILAHEKLKARLVAYEELLAEITANMQIANQTQTGE
jgi:hypothetical protein